MPRPFWKGNIFTNPIYSLVDSSENPQMWATKDKQEVFVNRRNIKFSSTAKNFFLSQPFKIYTGYDYLLKTLNQSSIDFNLSTLVNTRETNVTHKAKQTKHQRKINAATGAKKKLINVSKAKKNIKKKK